jgi:hypothetical protein
MELERKHALYALGVAAGAAAVAVVMFQRRHDATRATPDWNDPAQPIEGTGGLGQATGLPLMPSPGASWHAVRPGTPHMRAGSRLMRDYGAATLADDPESLVR